MTYQSQNVATGRHILPDLTRAFALIGIALVNVGYIAWPSMSGYLDGGLATGADVASHYTVSALFLYKSYTLFSFMFGVGFAYQITSAERRGVSFTGQYWRRIIGLVVLGMLHVALLFQGDILVIYAILGSLLFLFRNASGRTLMRWAVAVYAVQVLIWVIFAGLMWLGATYQPEAMAEQQAIFDATAVETRAIFGNGTFSEAMNQRLLEWGEVITAGVLMQGFGAFSFFLLGLAAVRAGVIANPNAPIWQRARRVFLPIGLIGSALAAWVLLRAASVTDPNFMVGLMLITLFSPLASAGYLGLMARWAQAPDSALRTFVARGGTATLTAYLMQSLLFSLIFNGYGLGLFGSLGAFWCTLIAFGVALISIIFSSLWRMRFKRGPFEAVLRGWTYLGTR